MPAAETRSDGDDAPGAEDTPAAAAAALVDLHASARGVREELGCLLKGFKVYTEPEPAAQPEPEPEPELAADPNPYPEPAQPIPVSGVSPNLLGLPDPLADLPPPARQTSWSSSRSTRAPRRTRAATPAGAASATPSALPADSFGPLPYMFSRSTRADALPPAVPKRLRPGQDPGSDSDSDPAFADLDGESRFAV